MRNQGQLYIGGFILLLGVLWLIGNLLNVDFWALCWPLFFILLGVWIIFRPRMVRAGTNVRFVPLADVHRSGTGRIENEEFWLLVGDVDLDLSHAEIPAGETTYRLYGFVGDVEFIVPADVGFEVVTTTFLTTARVQGRKEDSFGGLHWRSDNYATAERKLRAEGTFFVMELKVRQV